MMTKKYARTMDEAFPGHGTYACTVHRTIRAPKWMVFVKNASLTVMCGALCASMVALMMAYFDVLV